MEGFVGVTIGQLAPYLDAMPTWAQLEPYLQQIIQAQYIGVILTGALFVYLCFFHRG